MKVSEVNTEIVNVPEGTTTKGTRKSKEKSARRYVCMIYANHPPYI